VAYEIAKKLSVQGKSLGNVFIFDTYPTHVRYAYQDIGWLYILRSAVNLMTSITYLQEFILKKMVNYL
jgi:thioesterase domain-containing protein